MKPTTPGQRLDTARTLWGWEAHPGQREWMMDDSPVKVAACGRRWGKTEAAAVDAATLAISFPGSIQMIVAPTYDQARLIADGVERLLMANRLTRRQARVRRTPYPRINILGSRILARSADDDGRALRGHRADRVIVDEAAFVRDSVITEVVQPMLADTDGQLVLLSTPCGHNHFWRVWMAGQREDSTRVRSFRFPSSDNPHISGSYIEEQRRSLPDRAFRTEYLAEFLEDESRVFALRDLDLCRGIFDRIPPAEEPRVACGIDWARYGDWTVCAALETGRRPWKVVALDRYQGMTWEACLERALDFLEKTGACSVFCDATSIGDPLLEQMRLRCEARMLPMSVEGLVFTSPSKRDLVDHLALRVAHADIALPGAETAHGRTLLREMELFEYQTRPGGSVSYGAPSGEHDDCVVALALAARAAREMPEFRVYTTSRIYTAGRQREEIF